MPAAHVPAWAGRDGGMEAAGMQGIRPQGSLRALAQGKEGEEVAQPMPKWDWQRALLQGGFIEALGPTPAPAPRGWRVSPCALAAA